MQDFVYGEDFCPFTEEPTGLEIRRYHHRNFFRLAAAQSPSKIWRAAAGKIATRRLVSRIILETVVNASSRQRRGLLKCTKTISVGGAHNAYRWTKWGLLIKKGGMGNEKGRVGKVGKREGEEELGRVGKGQTWKKEEGKRVHCQPWHQSVEVFLPYVPNNTLYLC